jgi:hypothetical protein
VRHESPFYIERTADSQLRHQLSGQGTTTTIQAGRQTGKTSLLTHAINAVQGERAPVIFWIITWFMHDARNPPLPALLSEAIAGSSTWTGWWTILADGAQPGADLQPLHQQGASFENPVLKNRKPTCCWHRFQNTSLPCCAWDSGGRDGLGA